MIFLKKILYQFLCKEMHFPTKFFFFLHSFVAITHGTRFFYSLLNLTAEILNRSDNNNVDSILEQIYNLEVPDEYGAPVEVITPNLKDVRIFKLSTASHNYQLPH